jgi:hypothetical protein
MYSVHDLLKIIGEKFKVYAVVVNAVMSLYLKV